MKTGDYIVFAGPLNLNLPIGYSCKFDTKLYGMFRVTKLDDCHYDFDPIEDEDNLFCPFTVDVRDWSDGFTRHCTVTDDLLPGNGCMNIIAETSCLFINFQLRQHTAEQNRDTMLDFQTVINSCYMQKVS